MKEDAFLAVGTVAGKHFIAPTPDDLEARGSVSGAVKGYGGAYPLQLRIGSLGVSGERRVLRRGM